jgi:hypothetical protein
MKRSEMIIDIAIQLMSRLPEWEKQERLDFADEILGAIEILGMLPPAVNPYKINFELEDFEWETEDE